MTTPVLFEELSTENNKRIGLLSLNSEKTLNSLTLEMVELMLEKLQCWQQDDTIAAVFIQGSGEKAFCAGGDVQALYRSSVEQAGGPCEYAETFFEREYRLDFLLNTYTKPVIVWGHGIVMGGGLGVLAACNFRIVTEKTRIAMPEVSIALFPDVGGSYFLNRMPGECGCFLALTAAAINAADSLYVGLADYFIHHKHKQQVFDNLLALTWSGEKNKDSDLVAACLSSNQSHCREDMPSGKLESNQMLINSLCSGDNVESIAEKFSKLDTDDKWLQRAKSGLANGSPLAVNWIFKQLKLCHGLSLKTVFQQELLLATTIVRGTEFAEGVRALLIDKDQNPQWQYKHLAEVDADHLASYFAAPWPQNPLADL